MTPSCVTTPKPPDPSVPKPDRLADAELAVLEALAAQGESLESKTGTCTPPFRARLRLVDRKRRLLLLERSPDEAANRALLALPQAALQFEWAAWRIAFVAGRPMPVFHEGSEAIGLELPHMVEIARRRIYQRAQEPRPALRCVGYFGDAVVFEATVTDVSADGIGLQIDYAEDELEPGMVLAGYRLECSGREPASVDLEVVHMNRSELPRGNRLGRAGCRFAKLSAAALTLVTEHAGTERLA